MATMESQRPRVDSAVDIICEPTCDQSHTNPPKSPSGRTRCPTPPRTPKPRATSISNSPQPQSPAHPSCVLTPETIPKRDRAPEVSSFNAYISKGFRHHHVPSEISQHKRAMLNHAAYHTQSDAIKFHRIVEWDGTWLSTLSLPPLEYYKAVYFETTFPETYTKAEDIPRVQQRWIDGPEREYGLDVDSALAGDSALAEDFFDFDGYYGEGGEPEVTAAEKAALSAEWQVLSQMLKSKTGCTSKEALLRTRDDTQTRWLNQR